MKQNRPKVDLGLVHSMYGGVGYPYFYYMDTEASKLLFRYMRYYFRKFLRSFKRSYRVYIEILEKRSITFSSVL